MLSPADGPACGRLYPNVHYLTIRLAGSAKTAETRPALRRNPHRALPTSTLPAPIPTLGLETELILKYRRNLLRGKCNTGHLLDFESAILMVPSPVTLHFPYDMAQSTPRDSRSPSLTGHGHDEARSDSALSTTVYVALPDPAGRIGLC
jgi:hypothetical protein